MSFILAILKLFSSIPTIAKLIREIDAERNQVKARERLDTKNARVDAAIERVRSSKDGERGAPDKPA